MTIRQSPIFEKQFPVVLIFSSHPVTQLSAPNYPPLNSLHWVVVVVSVDESCSTEGSLSFLRYCFCAELDHRQPVP